MTAFIATLAGPRAASSADQSSAEHLFAATGCAACHTPSLGSGEEAVRLYSDLLLHDVGPALDDGVVQGDARGRDWRTTPLWGLRDRARLLHDGRARTIQAAVLAHGGEAEDAVQRFRDLPPAAREALLAFLGSL